MVNLQKLKILDGKTLDIYLIIIYSLLPISLILGNLLININILIIAITLIIYCYKNNIWNWTNTLEFKLLVLIQFYCRILTHFLSRFGDRFW